MEAKIIIDIVLDTIGISEDVAFKKNRVTKLVKTRQIIHFLLRNKTQLSFSEIGYVTGQSHCNVMHSIKAINNVLYNKWQPYFNYIHDCEKQIDEIKSFYFKMWIPIYEHSKI